jgi:hypothetical protein
MSDKKQEITRVEPIDPTKKNSPITTEKPSDEPPTKGTGCYWNGAYYGDGAGVCSGHVLFICVASSGSWYKDGTC